MRKKTKEVLGKNYVSFLNEVKSRIREAQYMALRAVNRELITLYWDIGKKIVEQQEKHWWWKAIVETLAKDLQKEYHGIIGFSSRNLGNMKDFYCLYVKNAKLQSLVAEISWVKNIIIMGNH